MRNLAIILIINLTYIIGWLCGMFWINDTHRASSWLILPLVGACIIGTGVLMGLIVEVLDA